MLRNFEVIRKLKEDYGIEVRSSFALNKILASLGLIERNGSKWMQTDKGMIFSPYRTKVVPANEWKEHIVPYLASKMKKSK